MAREILNRARRRTSPGPSRLRISASDALKNGSICYGRKKDLQSRSSDWPDSVGRECVDPSRATGGRPAVLRKFRSGGLFQR